MVTCTTCGRENPPDARFCNGCAAPLAAAEEPLREERKIVTVLFADLVGSTSAAERLDPEDVRARLTPYWQRVRAELEHHGGTVEKFIGDAVVAVFGAPVVHEDDPERAVRAGLAIRDWAREHAELQIRIAVATGEALVRLGARPLAGEGIAAGDVLNTASRLQVAAPANGLLVGEATYRATRDAIVYRELDPVELKGKAEPVRVWEALEARSRLGVDLIRTTKAPLIGRRRELAALSDALARARAERAAQLVTLVGVPGIGKSRLVYELMQRVAAEREYTTWRQGRSLPYGEGVSMWAFAEMVKAHTGILETDTPATAEEKLAASVAALLDDEAEWVVRHLRPLVGLGTDAGDAGRNESFAAWRRYVEGIAAEAPLVLVFEDVHWADDNLLDFVDHLVDWATAVPLLVVCTARPELLDRRPTWGGGKRNATTLSLAPLDDEETAELVTALLERELSVPEAQADVVARACGNPLYAEQFVRMLGERDGGELPATVQGVIAARLDALSAEEKAVLQDAAVLAKVFWLGAVAAIGGRGPRRVEELLHGLERKDFVRRALRSSVGDDAEYAFTHVLVRDVAYSEIPRAARAEKHRAAAAWIDSLGRPEDYADMLAHHYSTALDLANAAGGADAELVERARIALGVAAERAAALNAFGAAATQFERALELLPDAARERPRLLFSRAEALFHSGDGRSEQALEEARDASLATGDRETAAEAAALLAEVSWFRGRGADCAAHLDRARELITAVGASRSRARVLGQIARYRMLAADYAPAIRLGREAGEMAHELGMAGVEAQALITVGSARGFSGDAEGGKADIHRGLALALQHNLLRVAARAYNNLAAVAETADETLKLTAAAEETYMRLGDTHGARYPRATHAGSLCGLGRWDEALELADAFIAASDAGSPHYQEPIVRVIRALIRYGRDDVDGAFADVRVAIDLARDAGDPQNLCPTLGFAARLYADLELVDEARALAEEALAHMRSSGWVFDLALVAHRLGVAGRVRELIVGGTPWQDAALAVLENRIADGATLMDRLGNRTWAAELRLRGGEALIDEGHADEAAKELEAALEFYRSVGATRFIRWAESLLAAPTL